LRADGEKIEMWKSRWAGKIRMALVLVMVCLAIIVGIVLVIPQLPLVVPAYDFRAYWSAAFLLAHGKNFGAPFELLRVEQELTGWTENYPMMAWNPPWLLVMLLPYTHAPFDRAVWLWMLTSIALFFISAVWVWQSEFDWRGTWLAILIAFAFAPTLTSLVAGQVNVIVLFGLALFLIFDRRKHDGFAGAALALASVKPQLIYVTLPLLVLDCGRQRRWRVGIGLVVALLGLNAIAFFLRPTFLFEYATTIGGGNLFDYETPTLGGVLGSGINWQWGRLIGLMVLPLSILAWYQRTDWDRRTLLDATLLLSVITAPFAWSYDFVVLLAPLWRLIGWIRSKKIANWEAVILTIILLSANVFAFYERVVSPSEVYFFWIPWLIAGLYGFGLWRTRRAARKKGMA
jgi:hypothetical protein